MPPASQRGNYRALLGRGSKSQRQAIEGRSLDSEVVGHGVKVRSREKNSLKNSSKGNSGRTEPRTLTLQPEAVRYSKRDSEGRQEAVPPKFLGQWFPGTQGTLSGSGWVVTYP